jgi:hypothetical protein
VITAAVQLLCCWPNSKRHNHKKQTNSLSVLSPPRLKDGDCEAQARDGALPAASGANTQHKALHGHVYSTLTRAETSGNQAEKAATDRRSAPGGGKGKQEIDGTHDQDNGIASTPTKARKAAVSQ